MSPAAIVIERRTGSDGNHSDLSGQSLHLCESKSIFGPPMKFGQSVQAVSEQVGGTTKLLSGIVSIDQIAERDAGEQTAGEPGQVIPTQLALSLLRSQPTNGKQSAKSAIGFPPGGPADDRRREVDQIQFGPVKKSRGRPRRFVVGIVAGSFCKLLANALLVNVRPNNAGKAVAIGNCQMSVAQLPGFADEFIGV